MKIKLDTVRWGDHTLPYSTTGSKVPNPENKSCKPTKTTFKGVDDLTVAMAATTFEAAATLSRAI
jgi:hypothetical protein